MVGRENCDQKKKDSDSEIEVEPTRDLCDCKVVTKQLQFPVGCRTQTKFFEVCVIPMYYNDLEQRQPAALVIVSGTADNNNLKFFESQNFNIY